MCGLIYGQRKDNMPVGKAIVKRYQKQKMRGREGFGFITIDKGKISGIERFEKEDEALDALEKSRSSSILFHHRTPTSTPNYKDMTHPIVVKNDMLDKDYYLVHNGVIQNEDDLKAKHESMGFKYTTEMTETHTVKTISGTTEKSYYQFNDSESLAIEVALFLDGKQKTIEAEGSIAFICIEAEKDGTVLNIHYGRNLGNPLVVEDNNDLFFLKSTGDGVKVDEDEIITLNYVTGKQVINPVNVGVRKTFVRQVADVGVRVIGYGKHDKDVPSPVEYLPENVQRRLAEADDADWFPNNAMGADAYDDEWQDSYDNYKLTDEYLLELWAEIEAIQNDIKECKEKLASGIAGDPLTSEDIVYNEEYMNECVDVLTTKQDEANKLEHYLELKRTGGRLDSELD